jgi:hypothetical protein
MSVVLPRLNRTAALELVDQHRRSSLEDIAGAMPDLDPEVTYSPVGGNRIDRTDLATLRAELLLVARDHGMPGPMVATSVFEDKSARLIHTKLDMTPHEASHDEVWSYLTCCWLLDIAFWRFGADASIDRFVGHLNRNTFRRMWWRAEVLGPHLELAKLGEDELVNIMERPTLFSDRRLARTIALEHITRVEGGLVDDRMRLMREATKRLLRLTPFVSFAALDDEGVALVVADAFDAAATGLAGRAAEVPHRSSMHVPAASPEVTELPQLEIGVPAVEPPSSLAESAHADNFDDVAQAALDIARQTGRVTNISLREVVPMITAAEARDVLRTLIERGELVRRGVKRGTHYVIPDEETPGLPVAEPQPTPPKPTPSPASVPPPAPVPRYVPPPPRRASETALRRLLRRMR